MKGIPGIPLSPLLFQVGKPSVLAPEASQLKRQSSLGFLAFILSIAVAQAFVLLAQHKMAHHSIAHH